MTHEVPSLDRLGLRKFGLTTGAIVAVLFGLLLPWLFDHGLPTWPWVIAAMLWAWAILHPGSLQPVYHGWMRIGHVLGWINSRLILGIMFYLLVLPTGLLMRLFGNDPMARKLDKAAESYRVKSREHDRTHIERPF